MVPLIFKPVFVCIFTVHADENWLENERNHMQERRNDLNMLLLRSTNYMSGNNTTAIGNILRLRPFEIDISLNNDNEKKIN